MFCVNGSLSGFGGERETRADMGRSCRGSGADFVCKQDVSSLSRTVAEFDHLCALLALSLGSS